jgi:4-hydroxyphenylpyruvate 3-dimethylallyltransferase
MLERASSLVGLADPAYLLTREEVEEMRRFLIPVRFTFAIMMDYSIGEIKRVGVYALKLALGTYPPIDKRLKVFFTQALSYDEEEVNAIAWSFGKHGARYIKVERSYCRGLVLLMR